MILQKAEKINSLEEIKEKIGEVNVTGFVCPKCKSHEFNYYGNYSRYLVVLVEGKVNEIKVKIKRIRCKNCKKTHAVIPDFIVPYKIYGLKIINKVLSLKMNKEKENKEIEKEYGVCRQLIRKWEREFERIRSKVEIVVEEVKNLIGLKAYEYYKNYKEIYMMRREGIYNYIST